MNATLELLRTILLAGVLFSKQLKEVLAVLLLSSNISSNAGRHPQFCNRIHATQPGQGSCPAQRPSVVAATLKSSKCLTVTRTARTAGPESWHYPIGLQTVRSLVTGHWDVWHEPSIETSSGDWIQGGK